MTREEQIFEASKKFSEYGFNQTNFENGFINGAKWADKNPVNVLHDASEEPKDDSSLILYQYKPNRFFFAKKKYKIRNYGNWKNFVLEEQVIRWMYVKDLFPKGGEK